MGYIYVVTNQINGKQYIGQTTNTIKKRWQEHVCESKRQRNSMQVYPLYRAMNKYGIENFTIEQIEECSYEMLNEREQY